jgi:hypothetical protein
MHCLSGWVDNVLPWVDAECSVHLRTWLHTDPRTFNAATITWHKF